MWKFGRIARLNTRKSLRAYDDKTVTIVTEEDVELAFEKKDIALIRQALDF